MRLLRSTRKAPLVILVLLVGVTALPRLGEPQSDSKLFFKDDVLALLKAHVPAKGIAERARERGIDFQVTPGIQEELLAAGATDELLIALREIAPLPPVAESQTVPGNSTPSATSNEVSKGAGARAPVQVRENPRDGLKYAWIPPGEFQMGCSPDDDACGDSEKPSHLVRITKGFWIGQTDVTVGAYNAFAAAAGRKLVTWAHRPDFAWMDDNTPIFGITWNDAQAYCTWAGGRLPTEAEWEFAARAGSPTKRYGPIDEIAWYSYNSGSHPHDVGQKRANAFGLFDMLGNLSKWVNDWYDDKYYSSSPAVDPPGPSSGTQRVLRGASWNHGLRETRVSMRFASKENQGWPTAGFRCVGEQIGGQSAGRQ
jgi:formylglycine-generating enzyme required for sulfatase activity